jgi:hypothetical protein
MCLVTHSKDRRPISTDATLSMRPWSAHHLSWCYPADVRAAESHQEQPENEMNPSEPLHQLHGSASGDAGGKSSSEMFFDQEDLRRLRSLAAHRGEKNREVLEHFRRARAIAIAVDVGTLLLTPDQLEANARKEMQESAAKVREFDELLAVAAPESRWVMRLRADAAR